MPWRRTKDPYAIWVSEVMLQQTQVSVVIPYYERWMARFPSVGSLALASEDEVLQLWQGLGYYRRAKSLLEGARYVVTEGFPTDVSDWRKVPGVGAYTAGAISSISQNNPVPLVDGNVERVFARLVGNYASGPELTTHAWEWATDNLCADAPGDWNQALMELGATVCTPRDPSCSGCPLNLDCKAFLKGLVSELPQAAEKAAIKRLNQTFWILLVGDSVHLTKPTEGGWWSGMNILPTSDSPPCEGWVEDLGRFTFTVTNHRITAEVKLIRLGSRLDEFDLISLSQISERAIPAPHRKALRLLQSI